MVGVIRRPCSKCGVNRAEKFFKTPRGRVCVHCQKKGARVNTHGRRIIEIYGLTRDDYNRILLVQGGVCGICGGSRKANLDVDHDHAEARQRGMRASIRGLLCARCNRHLLPACMGNIEILKAAIRYLESPPAQLVLGRRRVVRRPVR
jgi:Recombination endonuclease VII